MEPFGDSLTLTTFHVVSQASDEQMAAKSCPDDHCYFGLFSRPNSDESIVGSEEIRKRCRLKVMLANIFIATRLSILNDSNPHLLSLGPMLSYCSEPHLIVLMTWWGLKAVVAPGEG